MGRNMVTRTLTSTQVTVLALDTETAEPQNLTYEIAGTFKDDKKLLAVIQKSHDTETLKNVKVVDKREKETLYGMSEDEFIAHSAPLDPNTRKPYADDVPVPTEQGAE